MSGLIGEGVRDLQVEKTGGDETDGVALQYKVSPVKTKKMISSHLEDPALLDVVLEGEPHEHGSQGVRVSQLRHCLDPKLLCK